MKVIAFSFGTAKDIVRALLSLAFIASGVLHFISPEPYTKIVPPFLPAPQKLVYLSGLLEIVGGLAFLLFAPATLYRRLTAYGLVALLVAVFPANVYQAVGNVQLGNALDSPLYKWGRLPFQAVFIWLVLWSSQPKK